MVVEASWKFGTSLQTHIQSYTSLKDAVQDVRSKYYGKSTKIRVMTVKITESTFLGEFTSDTISSLL